MIRCQVIHVQPDLRHQGQHVLRSLYQRRGGRMPQRPAQRAEPFGIIRGFGKIQRTDENLRPQRRYGVMFVAKGQLPWVPVAGSGRVGR